MKFHVYRDTKGEIRWRLVARNGRTLADSAEGYKNLTDCKRTMGMVMQSGKAGIVHDESLDK